MVYERIEGEARELFHALDDGHAENMGDGMFIVFQTVDGVPQSVALSAADLQVMLQAA